MSIEQAILNLKSLCRQLDEHPEYLVEEVQRGDNWNFFKVTFYQSVPLSFCGWVSYPVRSLTPMGQDSEGHGWVYGVECVGDINEAIDHIKKSAAI